MVDDIRTVAVVDIGKTNAKVVLVDRAAGSEIAAATAPTESHQDGPYPHLDAGRIWAFMTGALAALAKAHAISGIAVTAHGSAGAFLSGDEEGDGLALPILDYEFEGPDELAAEYETVRPDFVETLSPRLPGGLNLGAQLFWQQRRFPEEFEAAKHYVTYPQYFAWRLTGAAATEMCSMGAHSDLWDPRKLGWSSLVGRMNWENVFAPLRPAFERLGPVKPELAKLLGLSGETPVVCGIHDSSASLLPHVVGRTPPFTVVSTGTWTILFAVGGSLDHLDPKRDTLANVTPIGDPVPCARFMGGREFERLAGHHPEEPSEAELGRVIDGGIMALPSFVPGVGPFAERQGNWTVAPETLAPGERTAAASLYLALMTAESMACADARGPTIVEGPFAGNRVFCSALAAKTGRQVLPSSGGSGTSRGAALLFEPKRGLPAPDDHPAEPLIHSGFAAYASRWRKLADERVT
jgi:sugar (pentulose or hexulose) kinase